MGKRPSNQVTGKSNTKKAKVDPALVTIQDVIVQAEDLPERCRSMLVDMLPFCLGVASDERQEGQKWAVDAIEQTLNARKTALETAAAAEESRLANLKSSEATLVGTAADSAALLDAQKEVVQSAESVLVEKTEAASVALSALITAQAEQKACDARLADAKEEKAALEAAFEAHFQVPMQEGLGPHHKELQPFLKQIEMDASLLKAFPSSSAKAKDERGSFDEVVLEEVRKALLAKVAAIEAVVIVEAPASLECEAAVKVAENTSTAQQDALKQAEDTLETAKKEQQEREAAVSKAHQDVEEFAPEVDSITGLVEAAKLACATFEAGPLGNFSTYKARVAVCAEAQHAGA